MQTDYTDDEDEWDGLHTISEFELSPSTMYEAGVWSEMPVHGESMSVPPFELLNDGERVSPNVNSATAPVSLLVESLVEQFCTLFEKDSERSKQLYRTVCQKLEQMKLIDGTWNRGEFDVVRQQYLYQLAQIAKGPEMLMASNGSPEKESVWTLPQPVSMEWSRYHTDFEELSYIAGGGFGKVFRARNKLDGIVYAIKKVNIRTKNINKIMSHLSEVKTLAGLHHVNIVPYKTAWLEPLMDSDLEKSLDLMDEDEEEETGDTTESMASTEFTKKKTKRHVKTVKTTTVEDSSDLVVFHDSGGVTGEGGDLWTQSVSTRVSCQTESSMTTEEVASKAMCHYESKSSRNKTRNKKQLAELQPHLNLEWAVLYIQMSECQLTLRMWLDERNKAPSFSEFYRNFLSTGLKRTMSMGSVPSTIEVDGDQSPLPSHLDVVSDMFLQLINGLSYIHARDITHHDIKPSNIFVSVAHDSNILVQLGDFGLACPLQKPHEKMLGTPQYAAPEQLKGKCDKKSDIYSLGVILLELLLCFNTESERIKTVIDVKAGIFPEEVPTQFRDLIGQLLSPNVEDRPNSFELPEIFSRLCRCRDPVVEDLQKKLMTQDAQIAKLQTLMQNKVQETDSLHRNLEQEVLSKDEELSRKEQEIQSLRKKLVELESQDQKRRNTIHQKHHENRRLKKKLLVNKQQRESSTDTSQ